MVQKLKELSKRNKSVAAKPEQKINNSGWTTLLGVKG